MLILTGMVFRNNIFVGSHIGHLFQQLEFSDIPGNGRLCYIISGEPELGNKFFPPGGLDFGIGTVGKEFFGKIPLIGNVVSRIAPVSRC